MNCTKGHFVIIKELWAAMPIDELGEPGGQPSPLTPDTDQGAG